jgi:hypothetical protein
VRESRPEVQNHPNRIDERVRFMRNIPLCLRTMQAAVWAACLFLFTALAGAQIIITPLAIRCPTNVTLWTCSDVAVWQSPLPVPGGGCSNYTVTASRRRAPRPRRPTVMCRVIDGCQGSDTCKFTITVRRDTEPPVIKCRATLLNASVRPRPRPGYYQYPPPTPLTTAVRERLPITFGKFSLAALPL